MNEARLNRKMDELVDMFRAFQGEVAKGMKETNSRLFEVEEQVKRLVNAHNLDAKTGKFKLDGDHIKGSD